MQSMQSWTILGNWNFRLFFLNTKYRYDSSTDTYPQRLKCKQHTQSPMLPFNNQNILEYTHRVPKELALHLLVHSSISSLLITHSSLPVCTIVTFKQAHFYSVKCATPVYAFQFSACRTTEITPCICITDDLKLLQNGTL